MGTIEEDVTLTDWIRNIVVYVAVKNLKKQSDSEKPKELENYELIENFSSPSIAKEYLKLSDTDKYILTLNLVEDYSADAIAKLFNMETNEIIERITDSIKIIVDSSEEKLTVDTALEEIKSLQIKTIPDENLLKSAMDRIYDMKVEDWENQEKKRLTEEILKHEEETRKNKDKNKSERIKIKYEKPTVRFNKKYLLFPFVIAILVIGYLYIFSVRAQWTVVNKAGTPQLNHQNIADKTDFNIGDVLQTNEESKATLEMPNVGKVEVFENTTIERLNESYSAKLINGKLIININWFKIDT